MWKDGFPCTVEMYTLFWCRVISSFLDLYNLVSCPDESFIEVEYLLKNGPFGKHITIDDANSRFLFHVKTI